MIKAVQLDFAPPSRRLRILGMLLLAAGVASCAWTGYAYFQAKAELEALTARSAALQLQRERGKQLPKQDWTRLGPELTFVNKVVDQLSLPWDKLFLAVERSIDADVTLLALNPDVGKGELMITAEARSLDAMLAYVRRLHVDPFLRNAHLQSHQIQVQDPLRPVRFTVAAKWLKTQPK